MSSMISRAPNGADRGRRRQREGQQRERGEAVLPEGDVGGRSRSRPAPIHHHQQRKRESRDDSPPQSLDDGVGERKLGHEQHESRRHQQRRHAFAPAKPAREENAFGEKREERKAGVAEQADGHRRHLDRREKAEPVEREHDAVADEAHVERGMLARARSRRMPSATAAIAVRPSTMATGDSASHLPKRPAKPKSATAACSATSAAACVMRASAATVMRFMLQSGPRWHRSGAC